VKLCSAQPAAFKRIPKLYGIHLPLELIDAPQAVRLNLFAGRVERNAIALAERADLIPVRADGRPDHQEIGCLKQKRPQRGGWSRAGAAVQGGMPEGADTILL